MCVNSTFCVIIVPMPTVFYLFSSHSHSHSHSISLSLSLFLPFYSSLTFSCSPSPPSPPSPSLIGEGPMGPVVKQIMDHPRCAQLREADIILEVLGITSHSTPHPPRPIATVMSLFVCNVYLLHHCLSYYVKVKVMLIHYNAITSSAKECVQLQLQ